MDRARRGDESAFTEIVHRYTPMVFRLASRFLRDPGQVEEVAQDVFLKAFRLLDQYEGRGSFEGWLRRITTTSCLNQLRLKRRRPEMKFTELSEDEARWIETRLSNGAARGDQESSLIAVNLAEKVLEMLKPEDRALILLIDMEGLSIREAAEMLGWTSSKAKIRTFRARRKMIEAAQKLMKK
ncbi:MAG: sigma-70 family RNA polymerase sigma factor [Acidobacteriota bacterium]|nr:MAG: sigma-70 family RNA polymerase sigma factor [Acidobacteriota bacterium]